MQNVKNLKVNLKRVAGFWQSLKVRKYLMQMCLEWDFGWLCAVQQHPL